MGIEQYNLFSCSGVWGCVCVLRMEPRALYMLASVLLLSYTLKPRVMIIKEEILLSKLDTELCTEVFNTKWDV